MLELLLSHFCSTKHAAATGEPARPRSWTEYQYAAVLERRCTGGTNTAATNGTAEASKGEGIVTAETRGTKSPGRYGTTTKLLDENFKERVLNSTF